MLDGDHCAANSPNGRRHLCPGRASFLQLVLKHLGMCPL